MRLRVISGLNPTIYFAFFILSIFTFTTVIPNTAIADSENPGLSKCRDKSISAFDRIGACTKFIADENSTSADMGKALASRAIAHKELKEYGPAIIDYTNIVTHWPDAWSAFYNRANIHTTIGNYNSALRDYNEAIRLKPDHVKAIANRGILFEKLKQIPDAVNDFQQAYDLGMREDLLRKKMVAHGLTYE